MLLQIASSGGRCPIAILLCFATACAGGAKETADASGGKGNAGGSASDDLSEDEAVPMALVSSEDLQVQRGRLAATFALGSYETLAAEGASGGRAAPDPVKAAAGADYSLALAILETPRRAAGELDAVLADVQASYAGLFGASSVLGARSLRPGSYRLPVRSGDLDPIRLVKIAKPDPLSGLANSASLYVLDAKTGELELRMRLAFTRDTTNANRAAALAIEYVGVASASGSRSRASLFLDNVTGELTGLFGDEPPADPLVPAKTYLRMMPLQAPASAVAIDGAYQWQKGDVAVSATSVQPRYARLRSGDIEVFHAAALSGPKRELAQQVAFLTAEGERPPATALPGWLAGFGYGRHIRAFLVDLIRRSDINAACATAGDAFRSAFKGKVAPPEVVEAPQSLCRAAAADALDEKVAELLAATCKVTDVVLPLKLEDLGDVSYNLCSKLLEKDLLDELKLVRRNDADDAFEFVELGQAGEAHAALATGLLASAPKLDFAGLAAAWAAPEKLPAATLDSAQDLPNP